MKFKLKNILLPLLLSVSVSVFAYNKLNDLNVHVNKIEGQIQKGDPFKIKYGWLSDGKRSGVITYNVKGTIACSGKIQTDEKPAWTAFDDQKDITCTFVKKGKYKTEVQLQLYDGSAAKEKTDLVVGELDVQ